jgi:hypothetical protein
VSETSQKAAQPRLQLINLFPSSRLKLGPPVQGSAKSSGFAAESTEPL